MMMSVHRHRGRSCLEESMTGGLLRMITLTVEKQAGAAENFREISMSISKRIKNYKQSLLILTMALTGCIGYVGGGYDVEVPVPGVVVFGGEYERGPVVHDYGRRGEESRRFAGHEGGGRRSGERGGRR